MSDLTMGAATGGQHQAPPVAGADLDLGALFGARQIHTDEHGDPHRRRRPDCTRRAR